MNARLVLRPPFKGIRIDEAPPALSVEGRPMAFRLSEPIGDCVKRSRMRPEAEVARIEHNVFGEVAPAFHAAAPRHDAVGRAPDRRGRHRRSCPHRPVEIVRIDAMAAGELVEAPGVRRPRMAGERRAERDDETHKLRRPFGEFASVKAAEAPADEADGPTMVNPEFGQPFVCAIENALSKPEIDPLAPAGSGVAA